MMNNKPLPDDSLIVRSRPRKGGLSQGTPTKQLLALSVLYAVCFGAISLFVRFNGESFFEVLFDWRGVLQTLAVLPVGLCLCLLLPKPLLWVSCVTQFFLGLFILGSLASLSAPLLLADIASPVLSSSLTETIIYKGLYTPTSLIIFVFFCLQSCIIFFLPPYKARQRLPAGTLLFMVACIFFVSTQAKVSKQLARSESTEEYFSIARHSIQHYGYTFTWITELHSQRHLPQSTVK